MPVSYSQDFREKVITYVKKGNSCNKASIKFEIAANTVRNWYKRYQSEGHYSTRKIGGSKARVTNQEIALYIANNADFNLIEMGKHFNMSSVGAHYWLKKLGYSYKKKPSPMWKLAKKSEKDTKKK